MLAGVAALVLGFPGAFAVGFGALTGCTNDFGCTTNDCAPCQGVGPWTGRMLVGELVLLGVAAVLALASLARRARPVVGPVGWVVAAAAVAWFALTAWRANSW